MTSMDGDVVDMANIKPMLDRTTKLQRQVNGDLQWRVIVYDGTLGKPVSPSLVSAKQASHPGNVGARKRRCKAVVAALASSCPAPRPLRESKADHAPPFRRASKPDANGMRVSTGRHLALF